mmetsp:Transcript_26506/g.84981  ORF Transcript_26506/g.84981 Transcript_26506/m.84981 type:complete len:327 (-) Transcript_26506:164-1144(-)
MHAQLVAPAAQRGGTGGRELEELGAGGRRQAKHDRNLVKPAHGRMRRRAHPAERVDQRLRVSPEALCARGGESRASHDALVDPRVERLRERAPSTAEGCSGQLRAQRRELRAKQRERLAQCRREVPERLALSAGRLALRREPKIAPLADVATRAVEEVRCEGGRCVLLELLAHLAPAAQHGAKHRARRVEGGERRLLLPLLEERRREEQRREQSADGLPICGPDHRLRRLRAQDRRKLAERRQQHLVDGAPLRRRVGDEPDPLEQVEREAHRTARAGRRPQRRAPRGGKVRPARLVHPTRHRGRVPRRRCCEHGGQPRRRVLALRL